jgi:hypothetical protein
MKITIKELKNLIREAVFSRAPTFSVKTLNKFNNVTIKSLLLNKDRFDDPPEYGELRVYFQPTREIESFMLFRERNVLKQVCELLLTLGFSKKNIKDIAFAESGMQGDDFISLDVSGSFVQEWQDLVGENKDMLKL